mmetsp:Transcript_28047/g.81068  ORF Transcript_28047/g.81068 Transcript_28047/m.81068 type:complete len:285 (-) Transcript_28047:129-983(-)
MTRVVNGGLHIIVLNGNRCILHKTGVGKATLLGQVLEVIPIQRPRQAFAPQHLIIAQALRHTAVGVHVREVQLATGLEEAVAALQNGILIGTEVDNAVRYDDIDRVVLEGIDLVQLLDFSQMKFHVVISKLVLVIGLRLLGHGKLLGRHIDANHPALGPHQLAGNVHVASGTAAQIQHGRALEQVGNAKTAPVILGHNIRVDAIDGILDVGGHRRGRAAGVCLEIVGGRQRLAVVVRDGVLNLARLGSSTVGGRGVDKEVAGHGEARCAGSRWSGDGRERRRGG